MVGTDTFTPNLHLTKIGGDRRNWNDIANSNMTLLDAVISAFFTVSNMRGVWENSTAYAVDDAAVDPDTAVVWVNSVAHTSAMLPTTFAEARAANPTYWSVYSAPATTKGAWATNTAYSRNDFVLADGTKYAFCLVAHTSGATFAADLALGYWSVIIDLSVVGSLVLPVLSGIADANKLVMTSTAGTSYVINSLVAGLIAAGATTIGTDMLTAANATAVRSLLSLGSAALLDVGTTADDVVQLDASGRLPSVDGSQLVNLPSRVRVTHSNGYSPATGTTLLPVDNTIPQNTEGTQFMTISHTPLSASSTLVIEVVFFGASTTTGYWGVALFKDADVSARQAVAVSGNANDAQTVSLKYSMTAGTTSAITFAVRAGPNAAATVSLNNLAGGDIFGPVAGSSMTVTEYLP